VSAVPRSSLAHFLGEAASSLFAALFPSECNICSAPLTNISRLPVCAECLADVAPIAGPQCSICFQTLTIPSELSDPESRCHECANEPPLFRRAVSYGSYEGVLRELIHLLKYRHIHPAAQQLGRWMAEAAAPMFASEVQRVDAESVEPDPVLIIPVPLHSSRYRERGFNQAELTARAARRNLLRLCATRFELKFGVLVRRRRTESQVGMTREQRRANLRGAFAVLNKAAVRGRRILLVDDVFTTGATVSECSRVLLAAGAGEVLVATAARTVRTAATTYDHSMEGEAPPAAAS
jgi:ComF family protein